MSGSEKLQWGAKSPRLNKKGGRFGWMGVWIVEVHIPQMKVEREGGKRPSSQQKKRGSRSHRRGTRTSRVARSTAGITPTREDCNLAALAPVGPAPTKVASSRVLNHKLRVNLWAAKAGNRLAARKPASRLIENFPRAEIFVGREESEEAWNTLCSMLIQSARPESRTRVRLALRSFLQSWAKIAVRAERLGIHPMMAVYRGPVKFLMVRSPGVGGWDELLAGLERDRYELRVRRGQVARPATPRSTPDRVRRRRARNLTFVPHGTHAVVSVRGFPLCTRCGREREVLMDPCPRAAPGPSRFASLF